MSLFAHATRSIGLDNNPLRRRTDRVEGWARLAGTMIILVVTPTVTALAAYSAYQNGTYEEKADRSHRQVVQAVLANDATHPAGEIDTTVLAVASWNAPDDTPRTGLVRATAGSTAGAVVPIWVNASGDPTTPPRDHDETLAVTMTTAVCVPLCVLLLLGTSHLTLRMILDRRRSTQWQRAWSQIEPGWSGRPG